MFFRFFKISQYIIFSKFFGRILAPPSGRRPGAPAPPRYATAAVAVVSHPFLAPGDGYTRSNHGNKIRHKRAAHFSCASAIRAICIFLIIQIRKLLTSYHVTTVRVHVSIRIPRSNQILLIFFKIIYFPKCRA